ncbi:TAXI family TRAP transporter solute-binding subunit [Aeoliella mucimassa]|uniref:ABC transporter, phosphonate, periplasmic substrate-binding protein n=1 Tax=Aeoliella mucimassa TaxID=2527972 RepID=A0A518ARD7_9BACT|nr:TAXI family TRAP transporter solute-binding subunit [Aeoliella mucimassa]QDU57282.1 ABC transporter, phosphonate, periplasmic substrate-binding protein [Aeoliella mucimassa]
MKISANRTLRFALVWGFVLLVITSAVVGLMRRDRLPSTIRVATGEEHGLYHQVWLAIKPLLEEELGREVELRTTTGSVVNRQLLAAGEVDIAMMQGDQLLGGQLEHDATLEIVAPLYPEPLLVVAPRGTPIESIRQLEGSPVYLGPANSGSRLSAQELFSHFHVHVVEPIDDTPHDSFLSPLESGVVDAAIVVTGLQNRDVNSLLDSGKFDLVSIPESQGYADRSIQWQSYTIPTGYFSGAPTTPAQPVETLATAGLVVVTDKASNTLVNAMLEVFYEHGLRTKFANLIPRSQALDWCPIEPHEVSRGYFNPVDRLSSIAAMMESMAATKELLFALGAGLFLLWRRTERIRKRDHNKKLQAEKDRLDLLLQKTLDIERAQMRTTDPKQLRKMLDEVTNIKLRALQELTDEELYADQAFSIFLMQCSNLISKIQLKIISLTGSNGDLASIDPIG